MNRVAIPAKPIAFAAALFGLLCAALAQAENSPPPPSEDPRVYSLGDFNRLHTVLERIYTVEAYVVALKLPQCAPGAPCVPVAVLISDTPPSRISNEKARDLIGQFYRRGNETENLQSAHAFRVLGLRIEQRSAQLEVEKRYRLRIRATDNHRYRRRSGLVLEDFCALPDCAGRSERDASTHTQ
jgi:hypothetical protein